jgi:endonuclease/exonuclease/phosphatase family metal-dependent hydrolase
MNWKLKFASRVLLACVVWNLGGARAAALVSERLAETLHSTAQCDGRAAAEPTDKPTSTFRLMSFNIWVGGEAGGQPLEQTAAVIKAAQADIVGIQESWSRSSPKTDNAERLAKMLGWQHVNLQGGSTSIISRFPIGEKTPAGWGATIQLSATQSIILFNAHLAPSPYQPYQLASIKYGTGRFITTEAETIDEARKARGAQVDALVKDVKQVLSQNRPMFLTGDLNEPSHQDWTTAAAEMGHCQIKVQYPTTKAITDLEFVDAFRAFFPDETKVRGYTWTPTKADNDPTERHDRIDYVFFRGAEVKLKEVQVVGESADRGCHIVVTPYPSDHRGVVAEFQWTP